jgi:hypothetical protein
MILVDNLVGSEGGGGIGLYSLQQSIVSFQVPQGRLIILTSQSAATSHDLLMSLTCSLILFCYGFKFDLFSTYITLLFLFVLIFHWRELLFNDL